MKWPNRHSLPVRLVALLVLVSMLTLVAATVVLVRNDVKLLRDSMGRDLRILAELIGENSRSALRFDVPESARKNLESLRREYQVRYAALYDADGALFAAYRRDDRGPARAPPHLDTPIDGVRFRALGLFDIRDQVEITHLIRDDGQPIGAIRIYAHMDELHRGLLHYGLLLAGLFVATLLVAVLVSLYLQRFVSRPVLALAERAAAITESGDYTLPPRRSGIGPGSAATPMPTPAGHGDEIGILYAGFDAMLERIGERESELLAIRADLEQRVLDRTRDLEAISVSAHALSREQQLLLGAIPLAIIHLKRRRIARVNPRTIELFGWDEPALLGKSTMMLYQRREDYERLGREAYPRLTGGGIYRADLLLRRRDGSVFWGRVVGQAVDPDAGESIWIIDDIDREKALEQDLRRAGDAADTANRAKSEFLANMSHEIRTPLNAVIGLTRLALDTGLDTQPDHRLDARLQDYLSKIDLSAQALLGVIDDILDFSRIEAGKLRLNREPVDMRTVLEQVRVMAGVAVTDKGVALVIEPPDPLPGGLIGDPARLAQVLLNLVGNAVKFTHQGSITLRVRVEAASQRQVTVAFEVVDTGIGIPLDRQATLFEAFTQVDASTTREQGGTGLGLSISARLVALMGGRLQLESEPGVGSRFWFSLPFARAEVGERAPPPEQGGSGGVMSSGGLRGIRVLVAEDDPVNRLVARDRLHSWGVEVSEAGNGREAVRLAGQGGFDAILMDIQMPEMDGYQASRDIRALADLGSLPIIAVTAHAMADERAKCLAAGMDDYITKPVDPELLYTALCRCLGRRPDAETRRDAAPCLAPAPAGVEFAETWAKAGFDVDKVERWLSTSPEVYQTMLRTWVTEYGDAIASIGAALDAGDIDAAVSALHRLRGAAGALGALALEQAARQLEDALRDDGGAEPALRQAVVVAGEHVMAAIARFDGKLVNAAGTEQAAECGDIAQRLDRLEELLYTGNTRALDFVPWLQACIGNGLSEGYLALLEAIEDLDFDTALRGLRSLVKRQGSRS